MTTQSNNTNEFTIARDTIIKGADAIDGGTLSLAFAFATIADKHMSAPYMDGKVKRYVHFTLEEFAAGTGDVMPENKSKRGAVMTYLVKTVLDYSGPKEGALKTAINAALPLAIYKHRNSENKALVLKDKKLGDNKKTILCGVPALVALGMDNETQATEALNKKLANAGRVAMAFNNKAAQGYSDKQVLGEIAAMSVDCDGSTFLGDVKLPLTTKVLQNVKEHGINAGWLLMPESRNRNRDDEGNEALIKAIAIVDSALIAWLSADGDEAPFAPSTKTDAAIGLLYANLVAYLS